ncbi:UDP-glucuronosyltransferase 2B20-like [Drosophila busckii]|nr:UDP-glucuronosyltransferase 2B20-like [Drosophila busckii]
MATQANSIILSVVIIAALLSVVQGANILAVMTTLSSSHLIVQMSMIKVLAERGHNVTAVTTLKPKVNHKNINLIYLPLSEQDEESWNTSIADVSSKEDNNNIIKFLFRMLSQMKFVFNRHRDVMKDPRVIDLYENPDNHFDLVIIGYFLNNFQMGIAHKLKVPVIIATAMFQWEIFDSITGNPTAYSYVPPIGSFITERISMSLFQRLIVRIKAVFIKLFALLIEMDMKKLYNELYGNDADMPAYEELNKNVSLVLFNSYTISEGPIRANVPGVIEVGGIQVKETPDPIPKNLADFLDNAQNGAILLSLGTNVHGANLKPEIVQMMFNVLSKLKQRVIWKWEDLSNTPGQADNILYFKWLPQDDILAHPNIKLFITHAGRGGITEATYHGKPMFALPVFADQPANAEKMVKDGFGLSESLLTLEEKPFREGLSEVLNNPIYTQRVKEFSVLFRDRPLSARQTVVYWTEYVMRHHGAAHLQSPLRHMSYISANNLDVNAILIISFIILILIGKFVLKLICRKVCSKATNTAKLKTK